MKKLILAMVCLTLFGVALCAEPQEIQQNVLNDKSYLGINMMKQPVQDGSKQQIVNKRSFLFVNIIINGKVKDTTKVSK